MKHAAALPPPFRFAFNGRSVFLEVSRIDGLDLLDWLGLGRPEFGAIEARSLRPLCVRRLWAEQRNLAPFRVQRAGCGRMRETSSLRRLAAQIVHALGESPSGLVHFG